MSRSDRIIIAAGGSGLVLVVAAAWLLVSAPVGAGNGDQAALTLETPEAGSPVAQSGTPEPASIVVDVEGGVTEPGIRELPAGSRVADAITAAGGYAADADLEAAATSINLAARLADGEQIIIPRIGASSPTTQPGAAAGGDGAGAPADAAPDGPLDINSASADELEALPGIGPVTVDRIIEARRERPFESLEDALERGVLNRGQLDDLQGLATAG